MAFIDRFVTTAQGAIVITGNTLGLSKDPAGALPGTDDSIGAFITTNTALAVPAGWGGIVNLANNENVTLNWQENSSSAYLNIPVGATVLYAELVWGGLATSPTDGTGVPIVDVTANINDAVDFTTPAGTSAITPDPLTYYSTVAADVWYSRSQDVTTEVTAGGSGLYTVGKVPSALNANNGVSNMAGWSLIVVYQDNTMPARNLSVFAGGAFIDGATTVDVDITGFTAPPTGPVTARISVGAEEGDAIFTGDQMLFGPIAGPLIQLYGPNNPANPPQALDNFFASQINIGDPTNANVGNLDTTGTFGNRNQNAFTATNTIAGRQGWDITNVDGSAAIQNSQTSARIRFLTNGDRYLTNVLGVQIDALAADLAIVKTATPQPVAPGQQITYTLAVTNNGPNEAPNTTVTDAIPLTVLLPEYSLDGGTTWNPWLGSVNIGTLAVGATSNVLIRGTVTLSALGTISNTATVASDYPDLNPANNTSTFTSTLQDLADVYVTKVGAPIPVIAGQTLTYTVVVGNLGPSNATGVTLTDALPAELTNQEYSTDGGTIWNTWTGSLSIGNIAALGSNNILLRGTVDPATTLTISNTATVSSTTTDPNPLNNTATALNAVSTSADIYVTKSASPDPVTAGQTLTYTVTVGNNGPSVATAIVLTDLVVSDLLGAEYSTDGGATWNPWLGTYNIPSLAVGATSQILIRGTVSVSLISGLIDNTASVLAATPDPNLLNNTVLISTDVLLSSDVYIQKTAAPEPVSVGQTITYTLTAGNNGPTDAIGVAVTDVVSPTVLNQEYSLDGGLTWATWLGTYAIGTMTVGQSETILIRGTVDPLATGTILNTATITSVSPDPDPTNNTSSVTSNITPLADIYVLKTSALNPVTAGTLLTYTITVGNNGPSTASAVTLTDPIAATIPSPEYSTNGGGSWAPWTGNLNVGNLASGATQTVLIRGIPDPAATGAISNTATVSSSTLDPDPTNNSVTQSTQLNASADIYVTKSALPDPVIAGTQLVYTLTVGNNGPSVATAVTLTDAVAAELLNAEYSTDGGINWNTWNGSYSVGALAPSATQQIQIRGTVTSSQTGTIGNTANVTSPTPDPNPTNNTVTISTNVNISSDVYIQKTSAPNPVIAGNQLVYTLTVGNNGPSDATGVNVTDTLPITVLNGEYSIDGGLTWNIWTGNVALGSLAAGATTVVRLRGTVSASATGSISNTANVTSTSPDPDPTNNTATVTTNVSLSSDVYVQKTAAPNPVVAGETLTYTVVVGNNGPSDAQGVQLADTLSSSLTNGEYSLDNGVTWNAWGGNIPIGTVGVSTTVTVLIRGTVTPSTNNAVANTATVSSTTPDPDPTNNTSSVSTNVVQSADIYITKTGTPNPVIAGQTLTYTLAFGNNGPSNATSVTITDTLPSTILNGEYSIDGGTTWALWTGTYNISTLAAGAVRNILVRGTVNSGATGTTSNTVNITSTTPDPDPTNNTASRTTNIDTEADIYVIKTDLPDPVVAGEVLTYTVEVGNLGPSDALAVVLSDIVPSNFLIPEYSTNNGLTWLPWIGSLAIGTLVAGTNQTILIRGTISSSSLGTITNTANVTSNTPDPNLANNTSSTTANISALGDLAIVKTALPDPVVAGEMLTYSLVVTNLGPSDSIGIIVSDAVPSAVTNPEYSIDGGSSWSTWLGSYNVGNLVANDSSTILVRGIVASNTVGTVTNTATVTATTTDPNPANNTSSFRSHITQLSDVAIVKTSLINPVVAGEMISFGLAVTNNGPSDAQGVIVSDTLAASIQNGAYSLDNGTTWTAWTGSYTIGNLSVGTNINILIRGTVNPSTLTDIGNTATVSSVTTDPDPTNNTSTVNTIVNTLADIAILKSASPNPVTAGNQLSYTLTMSNSGPSDSQNVVLTDALPAAIGNAEYSLDGGTTWNPWTGSYTVGTLAIGSVITILVRGDVSATATTTLSNTAAISSTTPDPNISNNTSTTNTLVNNVEMTKTSNVAGAVVGDTIGYTLTVTNKGEVTAENVTVTDPLITGLTYANNLKLNGVSISGNITTGVNIGDVAAGQSKVITFDAVVSALPQTSDKTFINQAVADYVYRAAPTDKPIPGTLESNKNSVRVYSPMLQVDKTANSIPVVVGQPFNYTIDVTNTGDIAQTNVMLVDVLPDSFVVQSITLDGSVVTGDLSVGINIGDLAVGQVKSVVITIVIMDTVDIGQFNNLALAEGVALIDPNRAPLAVQGEGEDLGGIQIYNPKLVLAKDADKAYAIQDEIVTYSISATNEGNVVLNNVGLDQVTISDALNSALEFVSGSVTVDGISMPNENIFTGINIGSLAVNQTKVITFKAKVLSAEVSPITNTATAEFTYLIPGLPLGRGEAQSPEYILNVEKAILEVIKTVEPKEAVLGDLLTYTVTITNLGDLTAYNVRITDSLPAQVALVPGTFKIDGQVINGVDLSKGITIPSILPGQVVIVTYQVKVIGTNCSSTVVNQVSVTFDYRLPDGTGGTVTISNSQGSTTTDIGIATFKQMSIESNVTIPEEKPDIEAINNATGVIEDIDCHVVETTKGTSKEGQNLSGYKLIIKGNAKISIEYTALEETQTVHSAHYTVPFSTFIVLSPDYTVGTKLDVTGMIEDIYFKAMDTRNVFINITALINLKALSC